MKIEREEFERERNYLNKTVSLIRKKISKLGQELFDDDSKALEFKKLIWDTHTEMDPNEMRSMMAESDLQVSIMQSKGNYLQRLFRIQNKPYFGSIRFKEEGSEEEDNIYIGITHVEDKLDYYVHDWRSPICSMFYDYETGPASYKAPSGIIKGNIIKKRQYIIEDAELKHIFDNDLNISDSLLQEVLAEESSDKMKNIVNTIQEEQNKVIRNTEDKNLIVEGIAGSGKTSVALHRIAFLLYRIPNLTSSNVVVFTPNKVFSEYISNVLPELGEDNTYDMTFYDLLCQNINEYKDIENFTDFISRYYKGNVDNYDMVKYKQSDEIIKDIKGQFRLFMNGVVSQSMREKGLDYKLNFGIELPRLKEIAARYEKNHDVAQALWKENIRECKILAGMLQPVETFYPEIADIWVEDMRYPEIAELTCMTLFQELPYASEKAFEWMADDREYFQLCGFMLMARLLMKGNQLNERAEAEFLDQALTSLQSEELLPQKAAATALRKFAVQSRENSKKINRLLAPIVKSDKPGVAVLASEIKLEAEYWH